MVVLFCEGTQVWLVKLLRENIPYTSVAHGCLKGPVRLIGGRPYRFLNDFSAWNTDLVQAIRKW